MEHFLIDLKNKIDFFIRSSLKFSRKNYSENNESKDVLFEADDAFEREKIYLINITCKI